MGNPKEVRGGAAVPGELADRLGKRLRELRELGGYSLRDVEGDTGISNSYLNQLEQGKVKKPSPHFLYKLATFYKVPYEMLMREAGYILPKSKDGQLSLTSIALAKVGDLTEEEERKVAEFVRFLRSQRKKR